MEFFKADGLMKVIGPCYEKLVKEFIVKITGECNVEGNKEYRNVYVRGNFVKFSHSIINDYLERSKMSGTCYVTSWRVDCSYCTKCSLYHLVRNHVLILVR